MADRPQAIGLISLPPNEHTKQQHYEDLRYFLCDIFQEPDMEAIRVLLSIYVSHFYVTERPVWSFLLGNSGTGKSEIGIKSLEHLHGVTTVTELTPATFLSAYGENNGLLHRLTKETDGNGVIVFSDLTPLLNDRPEVRNKVIGILRRICDGSYEKDVGNRKSQLKWQGKITCVAACTPELERFWSVHRSLGERFLTLRWRHGDMDLAMLKSTQQIGLEVDNQLEFKKLVRRFVQQDSPHGIEQKYIMLDTEKLFPISKMIAQMRREVNREQFGSKRAVTNVGGMEGPNRIIKSLVNLIRGSASLFRRKQACKDDYNLALRLAIDSLPRHRFHLVREMMKYPNMAAAASDIRKTIKNPPNFRYLLDDLRCIEIIDIEKVNGDIYIKPTNEFFDLWQKATEGCLDKFYDDSVECN